MEGVISSVLMTLGICLFLATLTMSLSYPIHEPNQFLGENHVLPSLFRPSCFV